MTTGATAALVGLAVVAAVVSAILGMAGGIMLLSGMLLVLPPAIAIPLHGVAQLASNTTRLTVYFKHIQWRIAIVFGLAAAPGAALGATVVAAIPDRYLLMGIGAFILFATHAPRPAPERVGQGRAALFIPVGFAAAFLGMLVGATGPLIAPFFLRENLLKERMIATKAACQASVHLWKLPAFWAIGFDYGEHIQLTALLVAGVMLGTVLGKRVLNKVSERLFLVLVKTVLTAIACKLIILDGLLAG